MADLKKFAEDLVNLSVKDVTELANILKVLHFLALWVLAYLLILIILHNKK